MPTYPPDFLWGTATAAYQVEGGFNQPQPGSPRNNWATWEAEGRAERTGRGCRFWETWPDDLDRAAAMGLNAFRFSLAWARLEPSDGAWDDDALARYAAIVAGCRDRGLEPVVTLHHFDHPEWLGPDPWLSAAAPKRFARFCDTAVTRLGRALGDDHGQPPVSFWVTVNEPNALATATYLLRAFPRASRNSRRRDWGPAVAHLMLAHLHGYRAVHDAYQRQRWTAPTVTYNSWTGAAYHHDRLWLDTMRPQTRGRRDELRRAWYDALPDNGVVHRFVHWVLDRWLLPRDASLPLERELGADEDPVDVLALDLYDPYIANYVFSWRGPRMHPWDWRDRSADVMTPLLTSYTEPHRDKPLYILEHGIAVRDTPFSGGHHRRDKLTRSAVIGSATASLDALLAAGVPVGGYFHWSLVDNYEWGSWRPRFGIHGVDFDNGAARSSLDAQGDDAAGRFREEIRRRRPQAPSVASSAASSAATPS